MKKIILSVLVLLIVLHTKAQIITERNIYTYLLAQNEQAFVNDVKKKGFDYYGIQKLYPGMNATFYYKLKGEDGEMIGWAKNDEMYCVMLKPLSNYYNTYKEIFLTNKFKYSYTSNDDKYYEWQGLRIGVNDKLKIMSFYIALKKYLPKELTVDLIIKNK